MKLIGNDREMLIVRMRAYAFDSVRYGMMKQAEREADCALERFDAMVKNNPANNAGYWACFYFNRFKEACAKF